MRGAPVSRQSTAPAGVPAVVLGEVSLAVHHLAVLEALQQRRFMRGGPVLEQVELALAGAAREVVAARLQQLARGSERHGGIGAIELFLVDDLHAVQRGQRHLAVVAIARLQPRAFQVRSTRVLEQRNR